MKKESNEKETPFQKAHEQFDVQTIIKTYLINVFHFSEDKQFASLH